MENQLTVELKCYCCEAPYNEADSFCASCGYPFKGRPEEQKEFSLNYSMTKFAKDNVKAKVGEARIVLFVLAGFTILYALLVMANGFNAFLLIINLILAGIYAGLGFWAKKNAFAAIFSGALVYISIIILNAVFEPSTIFQGIIFKAIFIVALIKASYGAYKYKIDKAD